jgi:two-component system chemotaxis response regulator CheY
MDKEMSILIVDDFSTMRRILKNMLRELGFNNTSEADDGLTALPMLKSGKFDFLVTDWVMPGMDGLTLLKTIRSDETLCDMPVLMGEQIMVAADAGVDGYVVKPFTAATLQDKIEKIFQRPADVEACMPGDNQRIDQPLASLDNPEQLI